MTGTRAFFSDLDTNIAGTVRFGDGAVAQIEGRVCWGLVLKCYELRTRQLKMLNNDALRPLKHYFPKDLTNFGRRPRTEHS
jgi:hypothetical protein